MDILTLFLVVPVLTIAALFFTKDLKQARMVSVIGMAIQFFMSLHVIYA